MIFLKLTKNFRNYVIVSNDLLDLGLNLYYQPSYGPASAALCPGHKRVEAPPGPGPGWSTYLLKCYLYYVIYT